MLENRRDRLIQTRSNRRQSSTVRPFPVSPASVPRLACRLASALGLALTIATGAAAARITLPLDVPVPLESDALSSERFRLIDRPEGVYLYEANTARLLARLPRLGLESIFAGADPAESRVGDDALPAVFARRPGWPQSLSASPAGAPLFHDLNGDGRTDLLFALENGEVHAVGPEGSPLPGWPVLLETPVWDGPTVADVDRDGSAELLVATAPGIIHAFRASGAQEPPGWPVCIDVGAPGEEFWSAPSVATDAAGRPVIAIAGTLGTLLLVDGRGRTLDGWPVRAEATLLDWNPAAAYAAPTLCDFEGDGRFECLSATNDGRLSLYGAGGRAWPRWPLRIEGSPRAGFGRVTAADLDDDGVIEILLATDRGFPGPARLLVLRADGTPYPGWPIELSAPVNGGAVVADLTPTPGLEVIVAGIGGAGAITAFDARGRVLSGFPRSFEGLSFDSGPIVVDLDGRPGLEILALAGHADYGAGASLVALDGAGRPLRGFPFPLGSCDGFSGGLAAHDFDSDGRTDIAVAVGGRPQMLVFGSEGLAQPALLAWPRSGRSPSEATAPQVLPDHAPPPLVGPEPNPNPTPGFEPLSLPEGVAGQFDPKKTISFVLRRTAPIRLEVVDVRGRRVRNLISTSMPPGLYAVSWDGTGERGEPLQSGVYFYQLWVEGEAQTRQLVVLLR